VKHVDGLSCRTFPLGIYFMHFMQRSYKNCSWVQSDCCWRKEPF